MYKVNGKLYPHLVGSRKMVYTFGTAYKTPGGLTKKQLYYNKSTKRVVSLKKHLDALKHNPLKKAGWTAKKGKFGAVRIKGFETRRTRRAAKGKRGSRKQRGGEMVSDLAKFQSQPGEYKP